MARLVIFTFFLALASADAASGGAPPRRLLPPPPPQLRPLPARWLLPAQQGDYSECDSFGAGQTVCADNCTKVLLCMGGTLDPIVLEECEEPLKCNQQQGTCVNGTSSCETVTSTIQCNALGMFPDPYDCTAYHICPVVGEESVRAKCESGYAYNPNTTLCSKKLTDDVCTNLPIECTGLGETNVFPGNANIYYICVADDDENLYPSLYRCEHGGVYSPDSYTCSDSPP
ncbi:uncharacterized protein LOC126187473 [Schistocerca cancellata]|uniref:uncharacterized protein LOC126187473 n=1 Tax=Schistocerca cancellata TaxID=274614 RepID=UPI0021184519|nr:uncharacterized protein LOC126187473 [Schistocerca cancellata]